MVSHEGGVKTVSALQGHHSRLGESRTGPVPKTASNLTLCKLLRTEVSH